MQLGYILLTAINAIMPILLMIVLGYGLRRFGILNEDYIHLSNWLVFNICLPVMLFVNIYDISGFSAIKWDLVIYTVLVICLLFILSFAAAVCSTTIPERKGVVMQSVYRSNYAIIGLPLASALGGTQAMAMAAVISAFCIPVFNIFGVISLTIFMERPGSKKIDLRGIVDNIIKNPLIIGVVLGLSCLGLRQLQSDVFGEVVFSLSRDTAFLYTALNNLKAITSPLALIVLGGQFTFSAVKGMFREIAVGTVGRIIIAPLIGIGLAVLLSKYTTLLSCGPTDYPALIAVFGSPVAVSSAVMAAGMKNDGQLAAQLVVWTSLFSIFTIFITICIMIPFGLLTP